jgi:hypothetical protein
MARRTLNQPVRDRTKEDWCSIIQRFEELQRLERMADPRRANHIGLGYYYEILSEEFRLSSNYIVKIISSRHRQ